MSGIPTTAELQGLTKPLLAQVFQALGHDLHLVSPSRVSTWGTPATNSELQTPVRGLLMPASAQTKQAAAGAGLPVPQFEAYLPFDVGNLSVPGWYIVHEGQHYYPTADARDEGGQGIVYVVSLSAPGEVIGKDDNSSSWT